MDCKYIIDSLLLESDNNITLTFNAVTGYKNLDIRPLAKFILDLDYKFLQ